MAAKAGYLATAAGILRDNGSMRVCESDGGFSEGKAFLNGL